MRTDVTPNRVMIADIDAYVCVCVVCVLCIRSMCVVCCVCVCVCV